MSGLITEEYRKQNRELHRNPEYGISGKHYVDAVKRLCDVLGTVDVLDYGCGKRTLSQLMGLRDHKFDGAISEYDPAIPGFDILPSRKFDVVVCTEVLEHLEPETVENVLCHLESLTKRVVFFSVACGPSSKMLPDGRNSHLVQQPPDWWVRRLEKKFRMLRMFGKPGGFVFIGQSFHDPSDVPDLSEIGPPPEVKRLQGKSVYTDEQRCANILSSMLRGLPCLAQLPAHDKTMVLACYGPSLEDTIDDLKDEIEHGGDLWSTSGAHGFLIERGIIPMGHVEADPQPINVKRLGRPDDRVAYFVASAASREMFDHLHGHEVWIFHQTSSRAESELMCRLDRTGGVFTLDGGTNVGMTAIAVGSVLGYRKFSIHGMDCSFAASREALYWQPASPGEEMPRELLATVRRHAGAHPNPDQFTQRVWVGRRPFITSPQMTQGVQDYIALLSGIASDSRYGFKLHGDGMLKATIEYIREKDKKDAASLHRLRSAPANSVNSVGKLDYAARFKAGLHNTARSKSASDQTARSY